MTPAVLVPHPPPKRDNSGSLLSMAAAVRPISSDCLGCYPLFSCSSTKRCCMGYFEIASMKSDIYTLRFKNRQFIAGGPLLM